MRKVFCVVILCSMFISLFSGCGVLQKLGFGNEDSDEAAPASSITMDEVEAMAIADKLPVHLYFANETNTKLKMEVRYVDMAEATKSKSNLASIIVKELIKGPQNSSLKPTIPKDTELRSPVSIKNTIATVDLTKAFIDNHPGGKEAEQMTIYSIVNSLTELKEIEKVRFLIGGKERETFKGSFKFDALYPRDPLLISRDVSPTPKVEGEADKGEGSGTQDGGKSSKPASIDESSGEIDTGEVFDDSSGDYEEDAYIEILE